MNFTIAFNASRQVSDMDIMGSTTLELSRENNPLAACLDLLRQRIEEAVLSGTVPLSGNDPQIIDIVLRLPIDHQDPLKIDLLWLSDAVSTPDLALDNIA